MYKLLIIVIKLLEVWFFFFINCIMQCYSLQPAWNTIGDSFVFGILILSSTKQKKTNKQTILMIFDKLSHRFRWYFCRLRRTSYIAAPRY